jgi:uncharacterized protein
MAKDIRISAGKVILTAQLNDTSTAAAITAALPFRGVVRTWGDEIYFPIPVDHPIAADAAETVAVGDLGYWPTGKAFCIFFGPTPMSRGTEIRPASAVNLVGRVTGDAALFRKVKDGDPILVEHA